MTLEELRAELIVLVDQIDDEHVLRSMVALCKLPPEQQSRFVSWMESLDPDHMPSMKDVDRFLEEVAGS